VEPSSVLRERRGIGVGLLSLSSALLFMSLPPGVRRMPMWSGVFLLSLLTLLYDLRVYGRRIPPLRRVPWKLVPFLLGLFIQVEALSSSGWTDLLASHLRFPGTWSTLLFIALLSSLLAGLMNNHPMTIFMVRTLQSPEYLGMKKAAALGLIAGSNLGANLMLTGALAGLMWARLLSDKGYTLSFSRFSLYGFTITLPVMVVISLFLRLELG
jgi:arsenical pump membrane protein